MAKKGRKPGTPRHPNSGRKKGVPNKNTTAVKDAIVQAFEMIGGMEEFAKWCSENRTMFYKDVWPRVMPIQVHGEAAAVAPVIYWPLAPGPLDE